MVSEDTVRAGPVGRARGRARGRGRGGRGGTSAVGSGSVSSSPTVTNSPDLDRMSTPTIAPQSRLASEPSSTAASTQARNSGTTSSLRQPATSSTRGTAVAKPTRGPGVGRFRPKNIRRDEASRDLLAQQEHSKEQARAKEEARLQARSRGRSRRSRGDAMGRGGMNRQTVASGPFSQFREVASGRFGGSGGGFGGGFGGGGSGSGSGSGFGGFSRGVKSEGKSEFGSTSRYRGEPRINADRFAGVPPDHEIDSEDEATAAIIEADPEAHWPLGILRVDRKEEKKELATTAELEAVEEHGHGKEDLWVEGDVKTDPLPAATTDDGGVWHAAPKDVVRIKTEPGTEDSLQMEAVDFDAHNKTKQPEAEMDSKQPSPATTGATTELSLRLKPPPDPEEEVILANKRLLLSELGPSEDGKLTNKDGRLYLFQFPPIMPPLKPQTEVTPDASAGSEDTTTIDQSAGGGTEILIKSEEGVRPDLRSDQQPRNSDQKPKRKTTILEMAEDIPNGGVIGKLNVRQSGAVELDWGGMKMSLGPSTGVNFLTNAVIMEEWSEERRQGEYSGEAYGMGKIMGRFVVAPVWGEEEPWIIDPEDLVVDEAAE